MAYIIIVTIYGILTLIGLIIIFFINKFIIKKEKLLVTYKYIEMNIEKKKELIDKMILLLESLKYEETYIKELNNCIKELKNITIKDINKLNKINKKIFKFNKLIEIYPKLKKSKEYKEILELIVKNISEEEYAADMYNKEVGEYLLYYNKFKIINKFFYKYDKYKISANKL